MHLCPHSRNLLIPWVTHLYLAANFRSWHERASLGKCGRKSSCAHPGEMKLLAWWVCRSSYNMEKPFENLHLPLGSCKLAFSFVCSWSSRYGFLLCSIQLPHEPSGRNFSSALQTRNESAHSRCFMESEFLQIERDFKGHEPAMNICGFALFVLQQNFSKKVSLYLPSPLAHIPCFPQTCPASVLSLHSWKLLWLRFQTDLISLNLVVTSLFTCSFATQKHSTQWTTPSSLKYSCF